MPQEWIGKDVWGGAVTEWTQVHRQERDLKGRKERAAVVSRAAADRRYGGTSVRAQFFTCLNYKIIYVVFKTNPCQGKPLYSVNGLSFVELVIFFSSTFLSHFVLCAFFFLWLLHGCGACLSIISWFKKQFCTLTFLLPFSNSLGWLPKLQMATHQLAGIRLYTQEFKHTQSGCK